MSAAFRHLPLSDVQAGMVLSADLLDLQGHMLLPQGTVLTETMLGLMPRHGIANLPVEAPALSPEEQAALAARLRERIAYLFRQHSPEREEDYAAGVLRDMVSLYRLGREAA